MEFGGNKMKPIKIFCDFDGTITATDNIIAIMNHFVPDKAAPIVKKILAKEISIKDGVAKMFALLPSSSKEDIISYLQENAIIRDGFAEFMMFVRDKKIPFFVVSGGIDFFVEPMLTPFGPYEAIYSNHSNFTREHIEVLYPHTCDELCTNFVTQGCGCCKPTIMRKHSDETFFNIIIGDSITDFEAAKQADFVIARDILLENCEKNGLSHKPFTTFYDCIEIIEALQEVKSQ